MSESCGEKPEKTPTKREAQAAIDARKAEGTQVPPPETPEQRDAFYAAPRDSEIARLNYPWLNGETGDKPSPTAKPVASHETPSGETQAKEVSTGETQTVLEEAMKCVGGPRRRDYGTPDENFGRIADLWNVHLKGKLSKPVTPGDVAMLMILLKVARQANSPKRDNLVDIAGYAQCASELKEDK